MSNIEQSKAVFDGFRKNFNTPYCIADLTATVCTLCGVEMPNECAGTPVAPVIDQSLQQHPVSQEDQLGSGIHARIRSAGEASGVLRHRQRLDRINLSR